MTSERTKWWKAFLPKWMPGGSKDTASHHFGPDFDPFAQQPEKPKEPASQTTGDQCLVSQQESSKGSGLFGDDTYDDSHLESVFNEHTCRRNIKVSRSGRFKDKRRIRTSLPIQDKETETVPSGREDIR